MSKEVKVLKLPKCDICEENLAKYDSRLFARTTWAFLCEECYKFYGVPLGTGSAQRLILTEKEI